MTGLGFASLSKKLVVEEATEIGFGGEGPAMEAVVTELSLSTDR